MNQRLTKEEKELMDNAIAGKLEGILQVAPESDDKLQNNTSKIVDEMAIFYKISSKSYEKIANTWRMVDYFYMSDPHAPKRREINQEEAQQFAARYRNADYVNEELYIWDPYY